MQSADGVRVGDIGDVWDIGGPGALGAPGEQRNRRPRVSELRECHTHLEQTLDFVTAPIVVALGGAAVARAWAGWILVPLVHPSPHTQGQRSCAEQCEDWRGVGSLVRAGRL